MPVVSRATRGPKSEEILRQETLAKIDARKARIAAATARLVERPISKPRSRQARKVAVPAAIEEQNLAGATTADNSGTAVPTARNQNQDLVFGEGAVTVPAALSNKGIFPSPYLESRHLINMISENVPTKKQGVLKRTSTPYPSRGIHLECKAWKPCAKPPDTLGRRRCVANGQVLMDHAQYNRQIKRRARDHRELKVTSADWIFHRIPIERPDRFLPAPTVTGTKVRIDSPLVKQVIEFERWMRTTMYIEMGGRVY